MKLDDAGWKFNAATGNSILDVEKNARVVRLGSPGIGYLYLAEFWGDYSLKFPVKGVWRKTLAQAKKDLVTLKRDNS